MTITLAEALRGNEYLLQRILAVQSILMAIRTGEDAKHGAYSGTELTFPQAAVLWIAGNILPRRIISQDGMMVLIQTFGEHFRKTAEVWEKELEAEKAELTPLVLAVADRRLVQLSGVAGCFDLQHCRMLSEVPITFEGISYNLTVPIRLEWLRVQQERRDGTDSKTQAGTTQHRHAGHCPAGAGVGPARPGASNMGSGDNTHGAGRSSRMQGLNGVFEQAYGRNRDSDNG